MRSYRTIGAIAIIGFVLAFAFSLPRTPRSHKGITWENFERLRKGMTQAEAEEILGGPPGWYTDRKVLVVEHGVLFRRWWIGDEAVIEVAFGFDESNPELPWKLHRKHFKPLPPETLAEKWERLRPW
jgi:hypothetical protein